MSTQHQPEEGAAALDATEPVTAPAADSPTLQLPTSQPPAETVDRSGTAATGSTSDEPSATPGGAGSGTAVTARPAEVHPLRVGTVVWGLVLAFLGVGVLAWAGNRSIDVGLAAILLVAGAGVALLVGSLVTGARERRRAGTAD